jgi:NAD dependent epimerase/dehydratase
LKEIDIVYGDVTDYESVASATKGCSVVFHLAALVGIPYSYRAPRSYVQTNIVGTLNVLQASINAGVERVVHTSTSETYGTAGYTPIDEKHPLQGQSPYSASKIGADAIAESYYRSFHLPVATVRPFNTYGPRQSARAVIPSIICQALSGKKKIKLGLLTPIRDLNFVVDTVRGFIAIAKSEACIGEVVNIGYGKGITIGALAEKILLLLGNEVEIIPDQDRLRPEASEVMELICSNQKAAELAGWQPNFDLRTGLEQTISFIQSNLGRFQSDIYNI